MGYRRESEPSPLRAGIVHAGFSLAVFGGLAAAFGIGVHLIADPAAAGPRQTIALFAPTLTAPAGMAAPGLAVLDADLAATFPDAEDVESDGETGRSLVYTELDGDGLRIDITGGQGGPMVAAATGIRINGQLVQPGQSYGEVRGRSGAATSPAAAAPASAAPVRQVASASKAPADIHARPFSNPEGRPMVALVIGGLGINTTQTRLAIDSLPPDVTLSFAPEASRLDYWIRTARAAGHEVLIEVPMEAYDYGRMRMHPDTLRTGAAASANITRLDQVLGRASGYFGVINYQGAKLAADPDALAPVFEALSNRGLAFIDDGSVQASHFGEVAARKDLRYARAAGPIDTRQSLHEIAAELMEVETRALQTGSAIAAGFAFPVTIEAATVWISQLEEKGLVLAPVSALVPAAPSAPPMAERRELRTGSLPRSGLKTGG